jgi:UDP-N-acetyl-D-glucosamine dehydrogenase
LKKNVSVIGLGYVGLPLAIAAAHAGYRINGIDNNERVLNKIRNFGNQVITEFYSDLSNLLENKMLSISSDFTTVKDSEVILICVPTPLTAQREPDLSLVASAVSSISEHLKKGALVILESSVSPGTTRDFVAPLIQKISGLERDEFFLAFSPERIDPANQSWNIKNTPKLVAGLNKNACNLAFEFYSNFIGEVVICDSLEIAETAKLLENSFRLINISFINELTIFCQKLNIDVNEVIKAASTKPYGFMPFYPSIGVGGHCIPVDPLYLSNKAREIGAPTRFIDLADQINQEIPGYFVGRAEEKIDGLNGKKVLVIGVSYKPNVADVRESPAEALIAGLKQKGAQVFWHDDLVKEWNGEKSVALSNEYDLAIIATPHTYLDLTKLGDMPILNTLGSI